MRARSLAAGVIAGAVVLGGCATPAPSWVHSAATFGSPSVLPSPVTTGGMALDRALATRRSARSFAPTPLPTGIIGQLLWAGQGITSADGKRTAPSAGGLYPIELYVVDATRLIHYLPAGHRIEIRPEADLRPELQDAAFGQGVIGAAPQLVVVAAVYARTAAKYGARAHGYVDLEAGHVAQNILLQATALHLAAVPVGGLDGARAAQVLSLPPDQTVLYLVPIGWPTR
jgi:SagB-type dehydrogenase family enzyme